MEKKRGLNFKQIIRRNALFILCLATLAGCLGYLYHTAPAPGYCDITNTITPAEVFIEKAIKETGRDNRKFDGKNFSVLNCCLFYRMEGDFFSKLLRRDEGVWVAFAYERSQWGIGHSYDKQKYSHMMAYFDSCGRHRFPLKDEDPPSPPATFFGYGELGQDNVPVIDKRASKHFIKWPK